MIETSLPSSLLRFVCTELSPENVYGISNLLLKRDDYYIAVGGSVGTLDLTDINRS